MSNEQLPKPVTDSRFPGFNKEVEASHAAAAAPATQPPPAAPAPPAKRSPNEIGQALLESIVAHLGNPPALQKLLLELYPEASK